MKSIQTHPSTYAIVTLERMRNSRHMARTPSTTSILTMALRKIGNEALYARLNPPHMFPYHPLIPIPYLPLPSPWPWPWPKLQTKPQNRGFFRNVSLPHKREREIETPNTCIGHQEAPEMGAWSAVARSLPVLSPPWLQPPSYHHKATISEFSKHPPSHRKGKKIRGMPSECPLSSQTSSSTSRKSRIRGPHRNYPSWSAIAATVTSRLPRHRGPEQSASVLGR
jgi:hypothetical protein